MSYCNWDDINSLLPSYDQIGAYSDDSENFGMVLASKNDGQLVVVFRGTIESAVSNLVEDAYIYPRTQAWKGFRKVPQDVYVHPGFWEAWGVLKPGIMMGIKMGMIQYNATKITFTGHSLGGALATIAAMDYWVETGTVSKVITYGCPRVGNYYFAHFYESVFQTNSFRFVNHYDFIPHLPFEDMGYYHTSVEYWFQNGTSNFVSCSYLGEDPTCSDKLSYWQWTLDDHTTYPGLFALTNALKTCNGTLMDQAIRPLEAHRRPDRLKQYELGAERPL
jgi:predicted lipase